MPFPIRQTLTASLGGAIIAGTAGWVAARTQADAELRALEHVTAWAAILLGLLLLSRWREESLAIGSSLLAGGAGFLVTRKMATQHLRAKRGASPLV